MRSSSQAKSADNMLCVVSLPRTSLLIRGGGGGGDTVLLVLIKKTTLIASDNGSIRKYIEK
jgi:hypothetical protein